ncbi:MAG: UDP-N-acetylenolpyruvoylglucosamine reductase, partial [Kordiimonadaceae bacterium]|nr:UDP-N-acetylenolpyruvoylglucosamine reductase [Kordiimonadaceae bacterium]
MSATLNHRILDDFNLDVRGKIEFDATLSKLTWFRTGGNADILFTPEDEEDLSIFLKSLPGDIPVMALGVGSNMLIRDGGIEGVVI